MLKVGLTGGIGSGKSTVSGMLSEMGAYIFDADYEAKKFLEEDEVVQNELISEFGTDILNAKRAIDKRKLARVAFQMEENQLRLNAIIHPYVFEEFYRHYERISRSDRYSLFILDAALIYESGLDQHMDYVIVVASLLKHRIERALKRGVLTREEILRRVELQWSDEEKVGMADFVIRNNGTEHELLEQVREIYSQLV